MGKVLTTCLDCGKPSKRNRCRYHQKVWEQNRSAKRVMYRDPEYISWVKGDRCEICGSMEDLTKDHKVPISLGGTNEASNLRTLCRKCNSSKSNRPLNMVREG